MSVGALLRKDLHVEWRSRDALAATATVALLTALVGNLAWSGRIAPHNAVPGALWAAIVFGAQVGLARGFVVERERGTLEGLLASPASSLSIFVGKLVVHLVVVALVALLSWIALSLFFGVPAAAFSLGHFLVLLLGGFGVTLVTTLASALAMHGRNWVLLVPLLALPSLFPVLATAIPATGALLEGAPLVAVWPHLRVLIGFDLVFGAAAWLLAPYLLEP